MPPHPIAHGFRASSPRRDSSHLEFVFGCLAWVPEFGESTRSCISISISISRRLAIVASKFELHQSHDDNHHHHHHYHSQQSTVKVLSNAFAFCLLPFAFCILLCSCSCICSFSMCPTCPETSPQHCHHLVSLAMPSLATQLPRSLHSKALLLLPPHCHRHWHWHLSCRLHHATAVGLEHCTRCVP